jgi:hypothetical protein
MKALDHWDAMSLSPVHLSRDEVSQGRASPGQKWGSRLKLKLELQSDFRVDFVSVEMCVGSFFLRDPKSSALAGSSSVSQR